jgi:hypothetical protein
LLVVGSACTLMASGSGLAVVGAHSRTERLGRAGGCKGCWKLGFASVGAYQRLTLDETVYDCAQTARFVRHASSVVEVQQIGRDH